MLYEFCVFPRSRVFHMRKFIQVLVIVIALAFSPAICDANREHLQVAVEHHLLRGAPVTENPPQLLGVELCLLSRLQGKSL